MSRVFSALRPLATYAKVSRNVFSRSLASTSFQPKLNFTSQLPKAISVSTARSYSTGNF